MSSNGSESNGNTNINDAAGQGGAPAPAAKSKGAKGNQRGQTTLAVKITRWQVLVNNLAKRPAETPKSLLDAFTSVLTRAKDEWDQQKLLKADQATSMARRNDLIAQGDDLYGRLQLSLRSSLGRSNEELHAFGVKPARKPGRKKKAPVPLPEAKQPQPAPAATAASPEPRK